MQDMIANRTFELVEQESRAHRASAPGQRGSVHPAVVVLVPTRELAVQVGEQAERFGAPLDIRSTWVRCPDL